MPLEPGTATLELVCGWLVEPPDTRCGQWWMRWVVDLDVPFDDQKVWQWAREGVVHPQSPGTWKPATDGAWYRWQPGGPIPEGEHWTRLEFRCPDGCRSDVQVGRDRLFDAGAQVLRQLHDTRTPLFTTTVDALVRLLKSQP
jgi:hypothetical protein